MQQSQLMASTVRRAGLPAGPSRATCRGGVQALATPRKAVGAAVAAPPRPKAKPTLQTKPTLPASLEQAVLRQQPQLVQPSPQQLEQLLPQAEEPAQQDAQPAQHAEQADVGASEVQVESSAGTLSVAVVPAEAAAAPAPVSEGTAKLETARCRQQRRRKGRKRAAVSTKAVAAPAAETEQAQSSKAAGSTKQLAQSKARKGKQRASSDSTSTSTSTSTSIVKPSQSVPKDGDLKKAVAAAGVGALAALAVEQQQGASSRESSSDNSTSSSAEQQLSSKSKRYAITPKDEDLESWYYDVVEAAELEHWKASKGAEAATSYAQALQAPVKGWLDERLEYMGFEAQRFPQLLPLSPEQANASSSSSSGRAPAGSTSQAEAGAEEEAGSCTSRTFARWVQESEGDLPVLASQWHDVDSESGWDLHNSRLLLQESHAAHEWGGAAEEHAKAMIGLYEQLVRDVAGLPAIAGRRSPRGTFRGAAATYTVEAMVGDGLALQVAASHSLADNFSQALGASYLDAAANEQFMHQMGSGLRTSLLGAMALAHGDGKGLRLPPLLAPVQVMLVPIYTWRRCDRRALAAEVDRIRGALEAAGVRVAVDKRRGGPGVRFGGAERRGVPLRIEVGPREMAARTCTLVRRDLAGPDGRREGVSTADGEELAAVVQGLLEDAQSDLRWDAMAAVESNIVDVSSFYELKEAIEAGKWARGPWAGSLQDELAVQRETGATLRCFPLQQPTSIMSGYSTCLYSGYQAMEVAVFARTL